jgi:hypothetical protein
MVGHASIERPKRYHLRQKNHVFMGGFIGQRFDAAALSLIIALTVFVSIDSALSASSSPASLATTATAIGYLFSKPSDYSAAS